LKYFPPLKDGVNNQPIRIFSLISVNNALALPQTHEENSQHNNFKLILVLRFSPLVDGKFVRTIYFESLEFYHILRAWNN